MTAPRQRARLGARLRGGDLGGWTARTATTLAVLLGSIPVLGLLASHGRLVLHECLDADGYLAPLGVRLALLGGSADCPDGTVAMTPVARTGVMLVLGLAVPVILGHLLLALGGVGLTAVLARVAATTGLVLRAVLDRAPRAPHAVQARPRLVVVGPHLPDLLRRALASAHLRRGPPLLTA